MEKYIDEVFGNLIHDIDFIREYEVIFFNKKNKVELSVCADCYDDINDFHRQTFLTFENNKTEIIRKLEIAVTGYCINYYGVSKEEALKNIEIESIIVDHKCNVNKRIIGFVINDEYDPEMGIGIEMINEEVHAIGTQHLVC